MGGGGANFLLAGPLASARGNEWNRFCNFWRLYEYPTSFQSEGGRHTHWLILKPCVGIENMLCLTWIHSLVFTIAFLAVREG
jgi:hypothetical protein